VPNDSLLASEEKPMIADTGGHSYWNATAIAPDYPELSGDINVDVAIIGGGIVGITTARLLKDVGQTVAVLEARRVGREVTGKSTAKITSQHHIIYDTLRQKFGEGNARLYGEAQEAGLAMIRNLVTTHSIAADIETKAAYIWTRDEKYISQIEKEVKVAQALGLPANLTRQTGLPFEVLLAARFDNQAQFHPTKYVAGLAATIAGKGCHVFENSRAVSWEPNRVDTNRGSITARRIVMATHLPLGQVGGYYALAAPYAEPVIAAKITQPPDGMYISAEQPSRSIRTHRDEKGEVYGIFAGGHFKPGHTDDEQESFASLERWLSENFDAGPIAYRWVNHDYSSVDKAPFVGWSTSGGDGYLVATGFGAWGITNGTAAAMILTDLAIGNHNRWLSVVDATRVKPVAGGAQFVMENAQVAGHLLGGYLARKPDSFAGLALGQAAIIKIDGHNIAAYRDEQGDVHAVSAVCTHMGCLVGWNENDRTWDCPCHGSRFTSTGDVIHGPATEPLGTGLK
jgi:glycine/D-amino acid oxidase-like deaminating enzyme/nitrite reductase/ring-hydroxylating ferredoxin subunit